MQKVFINLKSKIINWCLQKQDRTIEEIYLESNPRHDVQIDGPTGQLKFIGEGASNVMVQTPKGWSPIKRTLKTVPYDQYELTLQDGKSLIGADEHLVITTAGEKYLKDLVPEDEVLTVDGKSSVVSVHYRGKPEEMYDLELDDQDHVFYTNGILSHNTTVAAMYILWFATFNRAKRCVIASKAMAHAVEIQSRVKFAYEELPGWIKAGCTFYNRTSIEFDNKSVIICEATSEKTGRGSSPSIIFLDEIAFISRRIQDEMWASLTPSLSTGGKFIITSTPNGDGDLFATLWRGANAGHNSFKPLQFLWWQHPDRDKKYYDEMAGKLGPIKTRQELDCDFISSDALLVNSIRLNQLRWKMPLWESLGFKFWVPEEELGGPGKIYMVAADMATGSGNDYTVIQIFDFPALNQIGEYRTNDVNIPMIYAKMKWILKTLTAVRNGGTAEVLWTFERNGVGEAMSALYFNDENQPEEAELFSDHASKFGVYTTGKTKILSALQLKTLIEKSNNGITINSEALVFELKHFVAKGGGYEAKAGSTDDSVMAVIIMMRLLKRLSEYNDEAFKTVHEYVDPDSPMDDSGDFVPFAFS